MTKPLLMRTVFAMIVPLILNAARSQAAETPPQFEHDIALPLKGHYVKCHGPAKQE